MSNALDPLASAASRPAPTIHRAPTDININEPVEIDYWVERLGVSEHSLRQAVADVGVSAQEVAEHLGKRVIAPGPARA
jgi:hypothetical protein